MSYRYHHATGVVFNSKIHPNIPAEAFEITEAEFQTILASRAAGLPIVLNAAGRPTAGEPLPPTADQLCARIDRSADAARLKVAGDPLRAVEYERAAKEAADFANAGYEGAVPPMVAAWVTPNRTAQQAADDIINEANAYNAALTQLRTARLQAKEQIRAFMAADQVEQAQLLASQTISAIEAAVAGIGNNA